MLRLKVISDFEVTKKSEFWKIVDLNGWYVPVRDTACPIFSFEVVRDNTPPQTTNPNGISFGFFL